MISIKNALMVSVPLIAVETSEPALTMKSIIEESGAMKASKRHYLRWDYARGLTALHKDAAGALAKIMAGCQPEETRGPDWLVTALQKAPEGVLVFMLNAHRFWNLEIVMQGVWNLRDKLKGEQSCLVMLCPDARSLPPELKDDVVVLTDTLPTLPEIERIADATLEATGLTKEQIGARDRIHDTMLGTSPFAAEQILAMSVRKTEVDLRAMWHRKVTTIEQTRGLSVWRGDERLADIGGLANAKDILNATIKGRIGARAIVFIDELDKGMAASATDTSGTTQDQVKVMLCYLQDHKVPGMLLNGPPGTCKTALCKAVANEHGIPLIMLDLGAMKGSLVGESERSLREAIKVIHAITDGKVLFIGACNRTGSLPPELRRRFNYVSMFMDLPDKEERRLIWKIKMRAFELPAQPVPDDEGWTGAEIENACQKAWAMGCTLKKAAESIVPVSVSSADAVQEMRRVASGKYTSASRPGLFQMDDNRIEQPTGRRFQKGE